MDDEKPIHLSRPQYDTLAQAYIERYSIHRMPTFSGGWFYAWRFETSPVITTWQTCASLCGMGLLEYETVDYIKRAGEWRPVTRYRVTEKGKQFYEESIRKVNNERANG